MKYFKLTCFLGLIILTVMSNRLLRDAISLSVKKYTGNQVFEKEYKMELRHINSSDLIENLTPEKRNKLRVDKIRKLCHRRPNATSNINFKSPSDPWLYVSHRYKIIYCNTPKAGCSSWLKVFAVLEGILNNTEDNSKGGIHGVRLPMIQHLSRDKRDHVMKNYRKVMMTRDPFHRTVSCYKDKFINHKGSPRPKFARLSRNVHKYYQNTNATDDINASFDEYLKYITDLNNTYNISSHYSEPRHWEPLYTLCEPCSIDYDFVLSLEHAKEDAQYFLREIGAPSDLQFPNANAADERMTNLPEYFFNSTTDKKLLLDLVEYYSLDYDFFDYSAPDCVSDS